MTIKAGETIEKYAMLAPGDAVVVGLSGGADSMALFHYLAVNRGRYGIFLLAAHLNHGLRGAEADRDEEAARDLCGRYAVPFVSRQVHMADRTHPAGMGTEEWGRAERYAFFEELAGRYGAKVATAHTLSDSVETMLFNLARGTGLQGLSGIPPVRGKYIRPLSATTREEVEGYCSENGLPYVTDSTNLTDDYTRNRIRHHIVPALSAINPAFAGAMGALGDELRETGAYLQNLADDVLAAAALPGGWRSDVLAAAPPTLRRRALYTLLAQKGVYGRDKVALCEEALSGGAVSLAKNLRFHCANGLCTLGPPPVYMGFDYEVLLENGFTDLPGGYLLSARVMPYDKFVKICETEKNLLKNAADCANIKDILTVRTRRPGDVFRPAGRGVSKTLKKYLNEQKIPANLRDSLPVVSQGDRVLYCWGLGFCDGLAPGPETRNVLVLREAAGPEQKREGEQKCTTM